LKTMDVAVLAGRDFEKDRAEDITRPEGASIRDGSGVIVDRAFAELHGWSPQEALNKSVYAWVPGANTTTPPSLRIIGVVENKPLRLLGLGATANLFMQRPDTAQTPIVRISGENVEAALREIDAVWERLAPNIAVQRRFADDMLESSMKAFLMVAAVFQAIAGLALLIAVLGLIGMSVHVIGRRMHEIGVRKTLGASVWQVLALLLKDFSRPVLIANLVAWPAAFLAASVYLSIFVTRSSLSPTPFAISLLFTLLIAWLSVGMQAFRAARLNPATVLRYE
jgi:putative ABC transport system permease protein